jgi:peptidyl-prolyl cis-trans isomerase B (cyclophilin B)
MPRPRTFLLALALVVAIALAGCGGGDDSAKKADTAATSTQTSTGCAKVSEPAPKQAKESKPKTELDPAKTYVATISTNCGDFQITLDAKRAPKTGGSFVSLAKKGFFDGLSFHRIVAGFVIQGGDPAGDGTGGPGYSVREKPPSNLKYVKGIVAMAKTEIEPKGTSGSQFFVVTAEDAGLPPDYALLGKVTKGMDVVDKIGVAQADPQTQRPLDPVVISKVTIDES